MDKPKDKTWRLRYLRILTGTVTEVGDSEEDLQAIEDLVDERFIRGSTIPDQEGIPRGAVLRSGNDGLAVPTLKGRLFIEDQRAILKSRTLIGRLKASWSLFSGIIGIIVGWSLGLLTPLIQQQIHPYPKPTPASNIAQSAVNQSSPVSTTAPVTPNPPKP
jgi:hypothetical protein